MEKSVKTNFNSLKRKKAQLKISFGMIFSIILIVIFLSFAFWAIGKFLDFRDVTQAGQFIDDLQDNIEDLRRGTQGIWDPEEGYSLPQKIEYVCFIDAREEARGEFKEFYDELTIGVLVDNKNMVFYPVGSVDRLGSAFIEHIKLDEMVKEDNPVCFKNVKGKVRLALEKNFGEDENLILIR